MEIVSRSVTGKDKNTNEDSLLTRKEQDNTHLLLIADGLGGHPGGEVASAIIVESVAQQSDVATKKDLTTWITNAGHAIATYGASHPEVDGMGSTASLVVLQDLTVQWAHVGDGRIYHLQGDTLQCKTRDQTLARSLYDDGKIAWHEIRTHKLNHFLEQCLGEEGIVPDSGSFPCALHDIIMLFTDGVHDFLSEELIKEIVSNRKNTLENMAEQLIAKVLEADGKDDISIILCRI